MSSFIYGYSSSIEPRFCTTFSYVEKKTKSYIKLFKKFFIVMADLLDAVVDIHDKLHMDVIFNPSRDSSSSSVTVQSKFMMINMIVYSHSACFGKFHYYFLYDHFSKKNQFLFLMCLSDLRRHFGK